MLQCTKSDGKSAGVVEEKKSKREQIIDEIIATEAMYVKDLTDIIDVSNITYVWCIILCYVHETNMS